MCGLVRGSIARGWVRWWKRVVGVGSRWAGGGVVGRVGSGGCSLFGSLSWWFWFMVGW